MKKRLLVGLLIFTYSLSAMAQTSPANEKIVLKKGFFSGYKFQLRYEDPRPVYGFSGMSFQPGFEQTLATHPPALTEAKKAFVFNGVGLLAQLGMTTFIVVDAFGNGMRSTSGGEQSFSLGPIIGCAAVAIVAGLIGTSKLKNGVRMYNENAGTSAAPAEASTPSQSTTVSTAGTSTFGFKGGLNMASQNITLNTGVSSITRFAFGGFMTIPVSENVTVQTEALWSMKGCKISASYASSTYNLHYLDFPVLLKYTFPSSGSIKPFAFAGPSLGILVIANGKYEEGYGNKASGDIKPLYNSTDFGLVFGGGANLSNQVSVDARYAMGLSNIASSIWGVPGFSIKNSTVSLMLGYTF